MGRSLTVVDVDRRVKKARPVRSDQAATESESGLLSVMAYARGRSLTGINSATWDGAIDRREPLALRLTPDALLSTFDGIPIVVKAPRRTRPFTGTKSPPPPHRRLPRVHLFIPIREGQPFAPKC
jgi:hypothetical protein